MTPRSLCWPAGRLAAVVFVSVLWTAAPASADSGQFPVTYEIGTAFVKSMSDPAAAPPGVNVECKPNAAHPYPVVLISGTHANMMTNWAGLGPTLANDGFCVYSAAIGGDPHSLVQTCGPVRDSVNEIAGLVDSVLADTGAAKVDLVGHSHGGLIAEYYTKFVGRAKVANVALLSPTTHGSTASGTVTLPEPLADISITTQAVGCPAIYDQLPGAQVVHELNDGPVTVPGVSYTVIETTYEYIVTPAPQAAFIDEPGVRNLVVQDYCPSDASGHITLAYSATVWALVHNALDPRHPVPPGC